jgi:hypothetical protein
MPANPHEKRRRLPDGETLRVARRRPPVVTDDAARRLADHLVATGERPVDPRTNAWLGEAEALAVDIAESDLDPAVERERAGHVVDLLSNVESTGDERADEHVREARALARDLAGRTDEE